LETRDDIRARLAAMGAGLDEAVDVAEAALLLALLDHPESDGFACRQHLAALAADAVALGHRGGTLEGRAWAVARVLYDRHGYAGDCETYDDPDNADLVRVVERRKGLPVALGILYMHTARAVGWQVEGLNFPSHFLLRLEGKGERLIVDPFEGGAVKDTQELRSLAKQVLAVNAELDRAWFEPVDSRAVLLRLLNNIRTRALQSAELERGAEITRRMILLAPASTGLKRDLGMVEAHRGNVTAAIEAFHAYLGSAPPTGVERTEVEQMLARLRRALN